MSPFSVRGRRVVVMGAARSGVAAAELLLARGARVTLTELRPAFAEANRLRRAGAELELGGHRDETIASADLVVLSPGVPMDGPLIESARARGTEVIGELELASRWVQGRVIAITGTKGKSTTTTLVGRMLDAAGRRATVGGNIGVPLSAQVESSTADTLHVVEVSSFQLESTTTFRPWIAVWLNLADDHLDRHPSLDSYVEAKARIFANQTSDDWAVLNADDPIVMAQSAKTTAVHRNFSLTGRTPTGFVVDGDWIVERTSTGATPIVPVGEVELTGRHMLNNVLAATAAASIAGVSPRAMREALRGFRGLPHVMEPVADIAGVRFVNDSKATNIEAAQRSIESFPKPLVPIVGGRFKGGDLRQLRAAVSGRAVAIVAIGEAAPLVHAALDDVVTVVDAGSMREAVQRAYAATVPAGVVLLAPACSSFDWFRDYAERGEAFKTEVFRLKRNQEGST